MNIAFVLPGLGFGGAERVVCHLANRLSEQHRVFIITAAHTSEVAYSLNDSVQVVSAPSNLSTLKTWLWVRKSCMNLKPDAVLAFMTETGIFTSLFLAGTGIPTIASERNDPAVERKEAGVLKRMLGALAGLFTSWYVFQSEGARSYYSKYIQKKSSIILNPLEVDKLPQRDPNGIDHRIVSVGRLFPQKNQEMLIRAFAASKASEKHTLHIYGEGKLRPKLEALIAELSMSDKVFLEGNSRHVHEDIKNAKLFAFTSDYEGLPNALMEAMAIGVPCVSTDCSPGGARMLINHGENGILVPCGDVAALTAVFDELLENEEMLEKFSVNGQKLKESVCVENIAKRWVECIETVR